MIATNWPNITSQTSSNLFVGEIFCLYLAITTIHSVSANHQYLYIESGKDGWPKLELFCTFFIFACWLGWCTTIGFCKTSNDQMMTNFHAFHCLPRTSFSRWQIETQNDNWSSCLLKLSLLHTINIVHCLKTWCFDFKIELNANLPQKGCKLKQTWQLGRH